MFLSHKPSKILITGKSGSGKTTYFERLLLNGFRSYWQTIFLYDWQGEMSQRLSLPALESLEQVPEALKGGFVIYDPAMEFEDDNETGLFCFSKLAFELCKNSDEYPRYPRLFACDEMQLLMGNREIAPEIKAIMQTGRRAGLDLVCVSQQLNEMHNVLRTQTTERVTFQHEDNRVLDIMQDYGFDPGAVQMLGTGEYLWRNDRGEQGQGALFRAGPSVKSSVDTEEETEEIEAG